MCVFSSLSDSHKVVALGQAHVHDCDERAILQHLLAPGVGKHCVRPSNDVPRGRDSHGEHATYTILMRDA